MIPTEMEDHHRGTMTVAALWQARLCTPARRSNECKHLRGGGRPEQEAYQHRLARLKASQLALSESRHPGEDVSQLERAPFLPR